MTPKKYTSALSKAQGMIDKKAGRQFADDMTPARVDRKGFSVKLGAADSKNL
jgi:hypothetical protein